MASEKHILLVEDNPGDVHLILRALRRDGIQNEVVVTRDGADGLDYMFCRGPYEQRDPNDMPVVILLDLKMPKVDGIEVLKALRGDARTWWMPIVIFTSSEQEKDVVRCYQSGANSYVTKPVGASDFRRAVRHIGLYWALVNVPPAVSERRAGTGDGDAYR